FLEQQGNLDSTTPLETRRSLARRLLDHGFARIAQTVLETPESVAREDKILLARASLQLGDGAASLSHISGLDGKAVDAIRDEALRLLGDYSNTNLALHGA